MPFLPPNQQRQSTEANGVKHAAQIDTLVTKPRTLENAPVSEETDSEICDTGNSNSIFLRSAVVDC